MVDRAFIGKEAPPTTICIDPAHVREFAQMVGETNPIYLDADAARAAGFDNIVAPPTYPIAFMAESMDAEIFFSLDLDFMSLVHGEQEFEYHRPVTAGEELTLRGRIADTWEKQGRSGKLDFVVLEANATDADGAPVYTSRITLIAKEKREGAR